MCLDLAKDTCTEVISGSFPSWQCKAHVRPFIAGLSFGGRGGGLVRRGQRYKFDKVLIPKSSYRQQLRLDNKITEWARSKRFEIRGCLLPLHESSQLWPGLQEGQLWHFLLKQPKGLKKGKLLTGNLRSHRWMPGIPQCYLLLLLPQWGTFTAHMPFLQLLMTPPPFFCSRKKYLLSLSPNSEDSLKLYSPAQIHMNHNNWIKGNCQNTTERSLKYEHSHWRAQSLVLLRP